MKKMISRICHEVGLSGLIIVLSCAAVSWLVLGCASNAQTGAVAAADPAGASGKSGAELWAANCVRCHNIRSPGSLSPEQWEVAMMHMRVRANLTPEEHKKILEFLKAGS